LWEPLEIFCVVILLHILPQQGNKFVRSKYNKFINYLSNKKILKTPEITQKEHFTLLKYQDIEQIKHGSIVCF